MIIWIVDFACLDAQIAIEVDDTSHEFREENERSHAIRAAGFSLLRFDNRDIAFELESGVAGIENEIDRLAEA